MRSCNPRVKETTSLMALLPSVQLTNAEIKQPSRFERVTNGGVGVERAPRVPGVF